MNIQEATNWFLALPGPWQERFLATLLHNLTVAARDTYEPQTENLSDPARMRDYNEVLHRVTAFLGEVLDREGDRYAGDFWLGDWLFEPRRDKQTNQGLSWAFETSAEWINRQQRGPESIKIQEIKTPKRIGA